MKPLTCKPNNLIRANRIRIALDHYVRTSFLDSSEGDRSADDLIDLLTDIRHYCDWQGYDFAAADTMAHRHYLEELDNDELEPA